MGNKGSEPSAAADTVTANHAHTVTRAPPVSQDIATIHSLRNQIDTLEKRRTFLEQKCATEIKLGKEKLKVSALSLINSIFYNN
jgi:hypothetical protein